MAQPFTVRLDANLEELQVSLRSSIPVAPMRTLPSLIIDLLVEQFERQLTELVRSGDILDFTVDGNRAPGSPDSHIPPNTWPCPECTIQLPWFLKELPRSFLIDLGWFEFVITCGRDKHPRIEFARPTHLKWDQAPEVKVKDLKTRCRYRVRIGWGPAGVGLPVEALIPIADALLPTCQCPTGQLAVYKSVGDWPIRFICRVCGKSFYCACFREALERHYAEAIEKAPRYASFGWPHQFIAAYRKSEIRDGICHLCQSIPSEEAFASPMYGSSVMVRYAPYIARTATDKAIDPRSAENEVRDHLGIPHVGEGWVSEVELLNLVKAVFPGEEVVHQASPRWLGRQRLDIFLPRLRVAIEYQGLQHYEAVELFGGEGGLQRTRERDRVKAEICAQNGVTLVYFGHSDVLTRGLVEARISATIADDRRESSRGK